MNLNTDLAPFLWSQIKKFFPYYLGAMITLYVTHYIGSYLPFFAKDLAEIVEKGTESIDTIVFFYLAIGIVLFRTASRLLFFYPARVLERNMRKEILKNLEKINPYRYKKYSNGQLFQIIYTDTEQIRALVGFALLQLGNIFVAMTVLVPKLANFNMELTLALIPMVISSIIFSIIVGTTRVWHRKSADMQGDIQNNIMEAFNGKKTIKNFHAESAFIDIFKALSFKELTYAFKAGQAVSYAVPLIPLGVGISFLWGAHIIYQSNLGASSLVLFSGFVFLFLEPLMFLSWIGVVFTASMAAWQRIRELTDDMNIPAQSEDKLIQSNPVIEKEERFEYVNLFFWDKKLRLPFIPNGVTSIVGQTGCGKSEILIQLAHVLKNNGKSLAYVGQSPYIYNDNIFKNIFLGKDSPTEDEINLAYKLLDIFGLTFLANTKEQLFKLEVGEHGKRLSGGQQKRLSIVKSIISGAKYLIWDDPFSSVDVILEKEILGKLVNEKILIGKTIILSSHRLSTVKNTDYTIYVNQELGILEEGDTKSLLDSVEKSKVYEFFEKQMV